MNEAINSSPAGLYESAIGEKRRSYYREKFLAFDRRGPGLKASWNWAAFFFGGIWALYRKMYGWFFVWWIATTFVGTLSKSNADVGGLAAILHLAFWVGFSIYANSLYHRKVKARIAVEIGEHSGSAAVKEIIRKKGGTLSVVPFALGGILLIGILLAVAIPAYMGATNKAAASVQSRASSSTGETTVSVPDLQQGTPRNTMDNISQIRAKRPEWDSLTDDSVVDVLRKNYYPELSAEQLAKEIGVKLAVAPPQQELGQRDPLADYLDHLDSLKVAPPQQELGPIDRWRYESCQTEAAKAPTQQGVTVGLRICREKFGQ